MQSHCSLINPKKKQGVTLPTDDTHLLLTEMKTSAMIGCGNIGSCHKQYYSGLQLNLSQTTFIQTLKGGGGGIKRVNINGLSEYKVLCSLFVSLLVWSTNA